ncbi:MAG: N-acetylneuraminate synthase family protein [Candidatus Paceibacterota bacterium]
MDIIAEIGLNHDGNLNKAIDMIRIAKECNCSTVKFQYYLIDILCADRNDYTAYDLLKRLCPKPQWIPILADECERQGLEFLITPFCRYSAEAIYPYVKRIKVASPEVANLRYLEFLSTLGKHLVLSTGKVNDEQLDRIFDTLKVPISLLYCVSKYPSFPSDYNLSEISRLRDRYKCKVGISCHCAGIRNAIDAVKLHGAEIVEKHFKIDENCVDAAVSLNPGEFAKMANIIKGI